MKLIPMSHCLVRLPLLPLKQYMDVVNAGDRNAALCELFSRPEIRVAAISLAAGFMERASERLGSKALTADDIETLVGLLARMCARPTPFGWAATASSLPTSAGLLPTVPVAAEVRAHMEVDESLAAKLLQDLAAQGAVLDVPLLANGTLRDRNGYLHFVQVVVRNEFPEAHLARAANNVYVDFVLSCAKAPIFGRELAQALIEGFPDDGLEVGEAQDFVRELVRSQLLTTDHLLAVTDRGRWLAHAPPELRNDARRLREGARLGDVASQIALGSARPVQSAVFAYRTFQPGAGLPPAVVAGARAVLGAVLASRRPAEGPLAKLVSRWEELFGDADVPLLQLVDEIDGVYRSLGRPANSVTKHLPVQGATNNAQIRPAWLTAALASLRETGEIRLESKQLASRAAVEADDMLAWCKLWQDEHGNELLEIAGTSISCTARLLGRFALHDADLSGMLASHGRSLQGTDTVVAELVYHPRNKASNICSHRPWTTFEICVRSGASDGVQQIELSDLLVCNVAGTLRLRSESLGKWILPRQSTAYNGDLPTNMPLFRFLTDLAAEPQMSVETHPRAWLREGHVKTPRVWVDNVLLHRATWTLSSAAFPEFADKAPAGQLRQQLRDKLRELDVPRWVLLKGSDDRLLDLMDGRTLDQLLSALRQSTTLMLVEELFDKLSPRLSGTDGSYLHEILLPFSIEDRLNDVAPPPRLRASTREVNDMLRQRPWHYARLYVHPKLQDAVLQQVKSNVVVPLAAAGVLGNWFFVRYQDHVGPHLRIRFQCGAQDAYAHLMPVLARLADSLRGQGLCGGLEWMQYLPEANRYGGVAALSALQEQFSASADLLCGLLQRGPVVPAAVLHAMQVTLNAFGYDRQRALELARRCTRNFQTRFVVSDQVRTETIALARQLGQLDLGEECSEPHWTVYEERTRKAAGLVQRLQAQSGLASDYDDVSVSVIHMMINRLVAEEAHVQECVYWDLLRRLIGQRQATQQVLSTVVA